MHMHPSSILSIWINLHHWSGKYKIHLQKKLYFLAFYIASMLLRSFNIVLNYRRRRKTCRVHSVHKFKIITPGIHKFNKDGSGELKSLFPPRVNRHHLARNCPIFTYQGSVYAKWSIPIKINFSNNMVGTLSILLNNNMGFLRWRGGLGCMSLGNDILIPYRFFPVLVICSFAYSIPFSSLGTCLPLPLCQE